MANRTFALPRKVSLDRDVTRIGCGKHERKCPAIGEIDGFRHLDPNRSCRVCSTHHNRSPGKLSRWWAMPTLPLAPDRFIHA
jgi:hypothetical protein